MKTANEIGDSIAQMIAGIMLRPSMHVGDPGSPSGADSLDSLLWHLLFLWCDATNRQSEFRTVLDGVRETADCKCLSGFGPAYRLHNSGATHRDCSDHVIRQWRIVAEKLGVPLTDSLGNP